MKKYLVSFAFAVLFFAGCKSDSGVDDLRKEIEALKSTEIASVNSQITSIKSSISDLQKVDAELKGYIKTLQDALTAPDSEIDEKYASLQKDIEDLEKADAALSKRIDELKDYCDQQNSSTREWVATTFTTLEQHSEVLEEIAAIKLQLGELGNSITTLDSSLSKKISDSEDKVMAAIGTTENSVKSWVNEQLSGYYTIAAADAKLKLLEDAYKAGDTSLAGDIKTLQENLNTAKSDLTAAYQKAIADAITENNGTINKKIADDIKAAADNLQSQINTINTRIDALESRMAALEASVAELIGMVQSIVVVPDYSDGSVKMTSSSDIIIRFEVYPLSAAKSLAEKGPSVFSLDYVETETKAGSLINLPISAVYFDGEFIRISTDCSGISESIASGTTGANARLRISSGKATRSSEYFQLKGVLVKSISLDKNAYTFHTIGDELQVKATVFPSDAMCNVVEWSSDNEDVATVDQNGIVKAIGNGATTIKVTAKDGSGTQAAFAVEVIQYVTKITLSKTFISLLIGAEETISVTSILPDNANDKTYTWSSSDNAIATVDNTGKITAKSDGSATVKATANDGSGIYAECSVQVQVYKVPNAVDLGLSVRWASFNLGASKPEEYGVYYAWGETETKDNYSWSTYKFDTSSSGPFSKYNTKSCYGAVDNKTVLEAEDDVASKKLGGSWRMPTDEEWTALRTNCTWTWTDNYNGTGVAGIIVSGNIYGYQYKSIFLPAAGYRGDTTLYNAGPYGIYWSSSLYTDDPYRAWIVSFNSSGINLTIGIRSFGLSVRPVSDY